jgi:exportin-T
VVLNRYESLDDPHKAFLHDLLRAWLDDRDAPTPVTILNKMAHLFALVFVNEFPAKWQTFFPDICSMVNVSPAAADRFLRIILAIDEEVVDRDVERPAAIAARNTALKDNMRVIAMSTLCKAWETILSTYEGSHHTLVGTCLHAISLYISWIDVSLVANEQFLNPVFRYLNSSVDSLRMGACEFISGLVNKGMPPPNKIQMLLSMQIAERVSVVKANITNDDDNEFLASLARLTNSFGLTVLAAVNRYLPIHVLFLLTCVKTKSG